MVDTEESEHRREACGQCGFDSDLYDRADTISSQKVIPAVLAAAFEGLDGDTLARRPDDSTWSIVEYLDHVREVVFGNRFAIETALAQPGVDLGDPPATGLQAPGAAGRPIDAGVALEGVTSEYQAMAELLAGLDDEQWAIEALLSGETHTVGWFARHVLHDGLHHLADIGRIRHGFGMGARPGTGEVTGVQVSDGGVPKRSISSAQVEPSGLGGDRQSDRRHHGRPVQAVCLWSADVIAELRAEGHPITAGSAGENITVAGVDWAGLRPGSRLDVGPVPMLITGHAIPCAKNAQWFADRDFNRILHQTNPGCSRLYAIPLASGPVAVGDRVEAEPRSGPA